MEFIGMEFFGVFKTVSLRLGFREMGTVETIREEGKS